jgi:YD repeat-containing protein
LQLLDYLREDGGRISSVTSSRAGESWSYTYDDLDRLTNADNLTNNLLDQIFSGACPRA